MKKILVTTAICLVGAASTMAQGRINFNNNTTTPIRITNGAGITNVLGTASTANFGIGPASARISLFAGLTSSSLAPVLIGTAANQTSVTNSGSLLSTFQGTFAGGNPLPLGISDGGNTVYLQMFVQTINGQYEGWSSIISVTPLLSPASATPVFNVVAGPNAWNLLTDMTLVIVPEPSSMALAGLGAASLLMFRRRK
jgi:hypothetical protein